MEIFFATLRSELYYIERFWSIENLQIEIQEYIILLKHEWIDFSLNGLSSVDYRTEAASV